MGTGKGKSKGMGWMLISPSTVYMFYNCIFLNEYQRILGSSMYYATLIAVVFWWPGALPVK
jgi:hypothetical protein